LQITAETVEKPEKSNLKTSKHLILLYANFTEMWKSDFSDHLAIYRSNFKPKSFTEYQNKILLFGNHEK